MINKDIELVQELLFPKPACIVGSIPALQAYGLEVPDTADIDIFCYSAETLLDATATLRQNDFKLAPRYDRVYSRWLKYGIGNWHTNSVVLLSPATGRKHNLVFKTAGRAPLSSMSQIIESFDFGLLHSGLDLQEGIPRSMKSYLFPQYVDDAALPLMPIRRNDWREGFMSRYQALREPARYLKYCNYGFDMSVVKDDLAAGYNNASEHFIDSEVEEHRRLGQIYGLISAAIQEDQLPLLQSAIDEIPFQDSLEAILASLN